MRRRIIFSILVILIFSANSCKVISGQWYSAFVPADMKKMWTICYSNKTKIVAPINMDGYYFDGSTRIMFYNDGTVVDGFDGWVHENEIQQYFVKLKTNKHEKTFFEEGTGNQYWGIFIVKSDTIIVQKINHPTPMDNLWMAWEEQYKIINRNTIRKIRVEPLWKMDKPGHRDFKKAMSERHFADAHFVPAPDRPDSTNWLKNEKWFWCKQK